MKDGRQNLLRSTGLAATLLLLVPTLAGAQGGEDLLRPAVPELGLPGGAAPSEGAPGTGHGDNTTVIPRGDVPSAPSAPDQLRLVALLTSDGQRIEQGVTWRVYTPLPEAGKVKLISTHSEASPVLKLKPGDYVINAAFGRAHLTRKVSLKANASEGVTEQFVLNAGGLRVQALSGGAELPANSVKFNIYSDRDQQDNRKVIMLGAKPGVVVRLNAGLYQVESTYGDANATVRADVTVEAGKLTEASLTHAAARATFKLVARTGGEAIPDTQWRIETREGQAVKDNFGAFFTHMMAPGAYTVFAKHDNKAYRREFTLEDGTQQEIEVLMEDGAIANPN